MKAIVQNAYGSPDVLRLKDVAKPAVNENAVLVRVHAAAINAGDVFCMRGSPFPIRFMVGFPRPKDYILGWDMAGTVEAVGKNVTQFQPGDEVFGACTGTCAEYACAGQDKFARKPTNLTFEQASAVPTAAVTALRGLRDVGNVQPGQKVLINGASGGVGTFAVQIAKALGAEVTGVCSTGKVEMVRSLGANHVIDYTREDFTQSGPRYDLILDNVANHSFTDLRRALTPQGVVIPNSGHSGIGYVFKAFLLSPFIRQQGSTFVATPKSEDLVVLKELIEAGKITPVIDKTYLLSETPKAFRYLDEGHARGKVVITIAALQEVFDAEAVGELTADIQFDVIGKDPVPITCISKREPVHFWRVKWNPHPLPSTPPLKFSWLSAEAKSMGRLPSCRGNTLWTVISICC